MSLLDQISVLILTYNEAPNIARTLAPLDRFSSIVVVDSGSTDETLEIARLHPGVRIEYRPFDAHADQWNFGLSVCDPTKAWVLALDADYVLPRTLIDEIERLAPDAHVSGYRVNFRYCVEGRPLRGSLYPSHVVLFRRENARFEQDGHTQRVVVDGAISHLVNLIDHDDRKPLPRWIASQQEYAKLEADHLFDAPPGSLRPVDRLRRMGWPTPILVFFYTLI